MNQRVISLINSEIIEKDINRIITVKGFIVGKNLLCLFL
jgi:hypothetical protein